VVPGARVRRCRRSSTPARRSSRRVWSTA
jgi:hypothetical protein